MKKPPSNSVLEFVVHPSGPNFPTKLDALIFLEQYHKNPTPIYISEKKYNKIVYFSNTIYPLIPVQNPKTERQKHIQKDNITFEKVFEGLKTKKIMTPEEIKLAKEKNIKVKGKFSAGYSKNLLYAYEYTGKLSKMIYKNIKTSDFQNIINEINATNKGAATSEALIKLLLPIHNLILILNFPRISFCLYLLPYHIVLSIAI